jgi:hypothetical protein
MKLFSKAGLSVVILALGATFGTIQALAQPVISAKSGMIAKAEGEVFLGDKAVQPSLTNFPDIKENGILRTQEGRAEVLLTSGTILRIGESSSFKLLTNRLIDTRLEVLSGSAVVEADEIMKDNNLTIVAKNATVVIGKHGLYRFDIEAARLKVFDGSVGVQIGNQTIPVGAGRMINLDTAVVEKFDKEDTDALDNWSKRRAERIAMANASSAKQVHDSGCDSYNTNFATPVDRNSPCYNPCGGWRYNRWYGLITYIPCGANIYSPYGYRYWSPYNVMRAYYIPPRPVYNNGGFGNGNPVSYPTMGQTSSGYSGTMASAPSVSSVSSSPAASASSGTTASSSAGGESVGRGSASSGGHGK